MDASTEIEDGGTPKPDSSLRMRDTPIGMMDVSHKAKDSSHFLMDTFIQFDWFVALISDTRFILTASMLATPEAFSYLLETSSVSKYLREKFETPSGFKTLSGLETMSGFKTLTWLKRQKMKSSKQILLEHGGYYHIYNRGNNGEKLFYTSENYYHFLRLYEKYIDPIADTYAWCLMGNHFHLLVRIKEVEEINLNSLPNPVRVLNPDRLKR